MTVVGGTIAALLSALAYGTFAAHTQALASERVNAILPATLVVKVATVLILQSFPFGFTWWATLAAFIWVMDGICAIISIHLCGLGLAQTTWSVVSLFVSFAWGKLFFREPIDNVPLSILGLCLMSAGMLGLGYIAVCCKRPDDPPSRDLKAVSTAVAREDRELEALQAEQALGEESLQLRSGPQSHEQPGTAALNERLSSEKEDKQQQDGLLQPSTSGRIGRGESGDVSTLRSWRDRHRTLLGFVGATYVGVCAGTMMVCLKMAPANCKGDQYTVSFGIGVGLVTSAALCIYFGVCALLKRQPPSFHIRVAAGPACLAGVLWSLGNYLSILAVASLGMAVGWPLVQCSLIVSNCWALFWYKEVEGLTAVLSFLASSCVILLGVCLLAYYGL